MRRQVRGFALAHAREAARDRRSLVALLAVSAGLPLLLAGLSALLASPEILRAGLPVAATLGFLSLGLVATAAPLSGYRERGTLRLLGATPARRAAFLLGHAPVRVGIGLAQSALVVALAVACGLLDGAGALRVVALLTLGMGALLALGYALGAVLRSTARALQLAAVLPLGALAASGLLLPPSLLPDWLARACALLPTSLLISGLEAELGAGGALWGATGAAAELARPAVLAMLAGCAALCGGLAAQCFAWAGNDGAPRRFVGASARHLG